MFCGFFISIRPSPVPTFAKHHHRPYPSPAFHQLFHGKHPRLPLLFRERTDFPRRYFPSNSHKAPRYRVVAWRFHIMVFPLADCLRKDRQRRGDHIPIMGGSSSFHRLLSVHDIHTGRQMFPFPAYALTLQRVDVLRTVSTHSPAFHHGGLSGEIARFGISHLCVDLVLVIGDCALQLRATGKHLF